MTKLYWNFMMYMFINNCELLHLSLLFLEDKQLNEKKGMHQMMKLFKKCVLGYLLIKFSRQGFVVYFSCIILNHIYMP